MKIEKFEDLPIWKLALSITKEIYNITSQTKFSRDYCLRDQIRKATISISSNIVEGFEKSNNNEFIRFLKIAKGSVGETRNQLYIALNVSYISKEEFNRINLKLISLASQIAGLTNYLIKNKSVIRNLKLNN